MNHLVWQEREGLKYLVSQSFIDAGIIRHAFMTKQGHPGNAPEAFLDFRRHETDALLSSDAWGQVARRFDFSAKAFLPLRQVHGDRILVLGGENEARGAGEVFPAQWRTAAGEGYDGVLTDQPGVALAIRTADCVPILLAAPHHRIIGALHVGWRGAALDLPAKAVRLCQSRFGAKPGEILAAVGPAIGGCCYQVGEDVFSSLNRDGNRGLFFRPDGQGHWKLNLAAMLAWQLKNQGLAEVAEPPPGCCTACNQNLFFSHRGSGGEKGRQLSFIALDAQALLAAGH